MGSPCSGWLRSVILIVCMLRVEVDVVGLLVGFSCALLLIGLRFHFLGTTDAIFLEKPSHYDLLIDLTTSTPNKSTRPTFYTSKPVPPQPGSSRGPTHRLSTSRFAWSDVKLWNELDRILQLDAEHSHHYACCVPSSPTAGAGDTPVKPRSITTWTDAWRVYEDVCVICAGLWIGSWRGNSSMSYSTANGAENWGGVRLEGDDDLSVGGGGYVRSLGMGIEGGPGIGVGVGSSAGAGGSLGIGNPPLSPPTNKQLRRTSNMSWSSGRSTVKDAGTSSGVGSGNGKGRQISSSTMIAEDDDTRERDAERRERQVLTTLALLQTLHAHTLFQLSTLQSFLARADDSSSGTVYLTPKDVQAFELGPLSGSDVKYLEWLVQEYAGGTTVVVKRGWKDLLGVIFGYG